MVALEFTLLLFRSLEGSLYANPQVANRLGVLIVSAGYSKCIPEAHLEAYSHIIYINKSPREVTETNNYKLPEFANVPMSLYKSMQGRYFVGYADNLKYARGLGAWAGLFNPPNSGVNLYVNVITATGIGRAPIRVQVWFNSDPPGEGTVSPLVTPSNTTIYPLPKPKVSILEASDVDGEPVGGIKAFVRRAEPETTVVFEEDGKYIFKPGGNLTVTVSSPEDPNIPMQGRVAFGWWEDKIKVTAKNSKKAVAKIRRPR